MTLQSSSDQLLTLKTLLGKEVESFWNNHADILQWSKDRNLQIEHLGLTKEETGFTNNTLNTVNQQLNEKIENNDNLSEKLIATTITKEEHEAVIEKMIQLLQLPPGILEEKSELYLEQQLADILGFDISVELDGNRLKVISGIMKAEPHLKKSPTDTLDQHSNYSEAKMGKNRSAFGWLISDSETDQKKEEYYFSLPLYSQPEWKESYESLKKWYKYRKMIMINPVERIAVVGVVGNIGPSLTNRKHFGGSPEVIREGKVWSPNTAGRVLMFLVDDPNNKIGLGPVKI